MSTRLLLTGKFWPAHMRAMFTLIIRICYCPGSIVQTAIKQGFPYKKVLISCRMMIYFSTTPIVKMIALTSVKSSEYFIEHLKFPVIQWI